MTTLRDATLAAAGGEAYGRWRRGAHRVRTATTTSFDVPGLEEALAVTGLPRDQRRIMETLRAGMRAESRGRRDAAGNRHVEVTVAATPERPATRLVVVEHAGSAYWSRDGERFGELGSARPPAETEAALDRVDDLVLERIEVTAPTATSIALVGELTEEQAAAVVDAGRILGRDAATARVSATVTVEVAPERCERRLRAVVLAATGLAGDVTLTSETVEERTELDATGLDVAEPRLSMSLPRRESVDAALRLGTPRGARATKATRGGRRRR